MRAIIGSRVVMGLLVVGAVVGFGYEAHQRGHCRHAHADRLTRVCVEAALGRGDADAGWHGHRARWVAERCAAHAQQLEGP
ncbi:hypothetical protein [Paraliomyxa miuraensis]|uniref:hypothetical protein n=1 Tax=Paraliomyxa miuraensis TaxID=376150 RepID=UPI00224CED3B|nr:hypothetical protein [Paraliomyxa miuraensis]MCX4242415.1 hypothetical protein [Paraliomyxa miuraensis]